MPYDTTNKPKVVEDQLALLSDRADGEHALYLCGKRDLPYKELPALGLGDLHRLTWSRTYLFDGSDYFASVRAGVTPDSIYDAIKVEDGDMEHLLWVVLNESRGYRLEVHTNPYLDDEIWEVVGDGHE